MKKVLIIAYYFPPSGGPGVQRVLKFVKYLPQYGWEPIVLTVENGDFPARDESLLKEIPPSVKVYRTKIFEPYSIYRKLTGKPSNAPVDVEVNTKNTNRSFAEKLAEFIRATFFIPDARIGWIPSAVREGRKIIEREKIQAIYSSSPPYTTAIIAKKIHKITGAPWIAGFRDPWTGFLSAPKRWFLPAAIDSFMERSVFEEANAVEVAWRGIYLDALKKYPKLNPAKFHHLPNGFDYDDYPKIERKPNEKFTVTYTGSMYGVRNPRTFLKAVNELVKEGKIDRNKIKLKFIGRFGSEVHSIFEESGLRDQIEVISYLPHSESVKELLLADALLLVVDEADGSSEIVPGKVFEYIGARRPIIALAPDGAIKKIIEETRSGFVASNNNIEGIKRTFLECWNIFEKNNSQNSMSSVNEDAVNKYDRKEITRQLARLLDKIQS